MIEVKLTVALDDKTTALLDKFITALSGRAVTAVLTEQQAIPAAPAESDAPWDAPKEKPAKKAAAPAEKPAAPAKAPAEDALTIEQMRVLFAKAKQQHGIVAVKGLLTDLGVKLLSDLPATQYRAAAAKVEALSNG